MTDHVVKPDHAADIVSRVKFSPHHRSHNMSILAITEQLLEPLDAELASAEVLLARAADPTATRPTTSELLQALEVQLVQFEELAEFRELLELRARAVISTIRRLLALQPSN